MALLSFEQALKKAGDQRRLMLGNGFSRACRDDIFSYSSLFDRADFKGLPLAHSAFSALKTTDFEVVMRALRSAAKLVEVYGEDAKLSARLSADADGLREVMVHAIADNHPERPGDIPLHRYVACRKFLANFERIYTLNYDLLLYWALMQEELKPAVPHDDGFRTPEDGEQDYVTWEANRHGQNVHFLHGALHVFDSGTEIQKYTWKNTGVPLIQQIRLALGKGFYPVFVAEGESAQKIERIRHCDLLAKAYRSFEEIGGSLFVYGHAMAPNDDHIVRLIGRGKVKQLFVSIYGDPKSEGNKQIIAKVESLRMMRPPKRPLDVTYFDAQSASVWG